MKKSRSRETVDIGCEIVERAHRAGETLSGSAAVFVEWVDWRRRAGEPTGWIVREL